MLLDMSCEGVKYSVRRYTLLLVVKKKRAYEMRISDWSSDVCSSDLRDIRHIGKAVALARHERRGGIARLGTEFGGIGRREGEGVRHYSTFNPVHFAAKEYLSAASDRTSVG